MKYASGLTEEIIAGGFAFEHEHEHEHADIESKNWIM